MDPWSDEYTQYSTQLRYNMTFNNKLIVSRIMIDALQLFYF